MMPLVYINEVEEIGDVGPKGIERALDNPRVRCVLGRHQHLLDTPRARLEIVNASPSELPRDNMSAM